jgi:sec-independent protein translocase protein TatA
MPHQLISPAFGMPGGWEWILIAILGLLIFGKRLPEVGKSLGRSIVEFKKGLKDVGEEIDRASQEDKDKDMLPPPDESAAARQHEQEKAHSY